MKTVDVVNEKPDTRIGGMRAKIKEAYFTESGESLLALKMEYSVNINGIKYNGIKTFVASDLLPLVGEMAKEGKFDE